MIRQIKDKAALVLVLLISFTFGFAITSPVTAQAHAHTNCAHSDHETWTHYWDYYYHSNHNGRHLHHGELISYLPWGDSGFRTITC